VWHNCPKARQKDGTGIPNVPKMQPKGDLGVSLETTLAQKLLCVRTSVFINGYTGTTTNKVHGRRFQATPDAHKSRHAEHVLPKCTQIHEK